MAVYFHYILPGIGVGCCHVAGEHLIYHLIGIRVDDMTIVEAAV